MENQKIRFKVNNPIFVSVSEAARLAGVQDKTIRRAIKKGEEIKFKIRKDRYQIDLGSLIIYLNKKTKLRNKLNTQGLGQYINQWQKIKEPSTIINQKVMKKMISDEEAKNHLDS
jgi:hypothetical protein